ncbi:MAG: OmpA family protein [Chitinophagaceae bacterium]|nr:MAG: OmpA family protein [Chitinophagaceae bacterium]
MKKAFLSTGLLIITLFVQGQILKKISDKVKNKVNATENKPVGDTAGVKKEEKNPVIETNKTDTTKKNEKAEPTVAGIKAYSKYDFVPGEKIIVFEDFMQDAVGDFPDKWNTNSAGETVTIEGKAGHWLKMTKHGVFMPDFIDSLPENFTLEFDLLVDQPANSWGIFPVLAQLENRDKIQDWRSSNNFFAVNILPGDANNGASYYERKKMGSLDQPPGIKINGFADLTRPVHVAMWRQKERLRVYLNEDKTWDVPKAISLEAKLNAFLLFVQLKGDWNFYVGNLRLATGAPDTRNKILKENKWVTHGILFDVNSDKIKPESYGSLKEMADIMKEFTDLKVKIVGHTDADGKDDTNLDLSKRRAASVKDMLAKEFGIDAGRMETDGKGESEPIDNNTTPAGKANNRRVEFIKI